MDNPIKISVVTPVYNRADKIHRVFDSLEKSTYRNFELIIMDDGSTDNIAEVVNQYKDKVTYPVTFLQQKNKGKHAALNVLNLEAKGEYIFQLDSDDEIRPDAMERTLNMWERIDPAKRDEYWCVVGRVIDQHKGEIQGTLYPEGLNDLDWLTARNIARNTLGEKWALQRADVLKGFRYPEPEGVSFVSERLMWHTIENDYKEYFTNEVIRVYYTNDGECLSTPKKNKQWAKNTYFNFTHISNRTKTFDVSFKDYWIYLAHVCVSSLLLSAKEKEGLEKPNLKSKLALMLLMPPAYIGLPLIKKKIGWVG